MPSISTTIRLCRLPSSFIRRQSDIAFAILKTVLLKKCQRLACFLWSDHLPQLQAGDIVEIRQTGTWQTMEDFISRGEGNIVVRIMCAKADPDYEQCRERGPKVGA